LTRNLISKPDLALFERVESIDSAVAKINRFYSRYHSMRYVDGQLVFRMTSPLGREHVGSLTERFHEILIPGGKIALSAALAAELDDVEVLHLPRLVIDFNRKDFGRLRSLIDAINEF